MFNRRSAKKREALRNSLWPESASRKWPPGAQEGGWARVPRTISLIACVLSENSKGADLFRTYMELMARVPEEGIVEIGSEEEHASLAGFTPNARGVRSWRERLAALAHLNLVKVFGAAKGIDQVILVHPTIAMLNLRAHGKVTDALWTQFQKIVVDTTGSAPVATPQEEPEPSAGIGG